MEARRMGMVWRIVPVLVLLIASTVDAELWVSTPSSGPAVVQATPGSAPGIAADEHGQNGFDVTLSTGGLSLEPSETKVGQFVRVGWPEASTAGEVGAPALPVVRRLFVVPNGADVTVSVSEGASVTLDSSILTPPFRVIPVQPPIEKTPGAVQRAEFQFNEAAYGLNANQPVERVTVQETGIARGQRLFLLEARPVAYNAVEQTLTVWPEMKIQVRFDGQAAAGSQFNPLRGLRSIVLNPGLLPAASPRGEGNYLIIAAPAYVSAISSFASAKQDQGFAVSIHQAESTKEAIKAYIQSLWGGSDTPDYILLVGDTDTIPMWTGGGEGSPSTDIQYVCMDGTSDWYPDIAIGRFSVQNATQLDNIVTKTLLFENGPLPDPTYLKRAVFMASEDNYTISEGTHNYVIQNYMDPDGFTSLRLYCHTYGATTAQVSAAFNAGQFYGIYSGHGGELYWADGPVFHQSEVLALTNLGKYPLIYSFACVTGTLTVSECFMETWQRAANKGGVIAVGSSVNSYWTEDDVMEKKLFASVYDPDDSVVTEVGPVWNDAKMRFLAQMGAGATTRRYFEMYNILGDPGLGMTGVVEPPTGLKVAPTGDYVLGGPVGGPFTPSGQVFTLTNKNETPLSYSVTVAQPWLTLTNGSGTLPGLGTADVTVSVNAAADLLSQGNYSDTINFVNLTDHDGDSTRAATLQVGGAGWNPVATGRTVTASSFGPTDIVLTATDPNGDPLRFEIESLPPANQGLLIDLGTGQQITTVPYSLVNGGATVRYAPPFGRTLSTSFTFAAWDATARSNFAAIVVNVGSGTSSRVLYFPMDTDPGWSTEAAWAFGHPTGGGSHSHDPSNGYTGPNAYGYNLSGDYTNNLPATYLTTSAMNLSNVTRAELRFRRWLGVELNDGATVEVSSDGTNWTTVWQNPTTQNDDLWLLMKYDIWAVADGQPTVYIRWGMGPTNASTVYPGWNIDDVEIWGVVNFSCAGALRGDVNNDATVNGRDVQRFVEVFLNPYASGITAEEFCGADMNTDGFVTSADLAPFVDVLLGP
jgi:hypothetical protein